MDYKKLNVVTVRDAFPMPQVEEVIENMQQSSILSTFGLASGYWRIELDEESPKTAFCVVDGLYEFMRMLFGLKGALKAER